MKFRIGQGFDVHPFETGGRLVLGGVEIPGSAGLRGHSDADALSHAICDAILGALGMGDIGQHFPDTDPRFRNALSLDFLREMVHLLEAEDWKIANIDSTIVTEEPMLKTYIPVMREKIADALEIQVEQISVKATRPEKLGSLGRKEGLLALAVTLLVK